MDIRLVSGQRHCSAGFALTGVSDADSAALDATVDRLQQLLPLLPEDPHLLLSEQVQNTEQISENNLPQTADVVDEVVSAAQSGPTPLDLVGIYAGGRIYQGLANSHGQRNWFETHTFNMDWCLYHSADKAVKSNLAGVNWESEAFATKLKSGRRQLDILGREPRIIAPGGYRVYLAPAAVAEVVSLMCWGGFSHRCIENRTTPLLKLVDGERSMSAQVQIAEVLGTGIAPCFQGSGFVRPDRVSLIDNGLHSGSLISPRSAKEHGIETNGAGEGEQPVALEMAPGDLPADGLLDALGTGIWVSNLWYLNFSDRSAGRITGMTRFATFWVENGEVVAPLSVMRFDDTLYNCLGENLVALSHEAELQLSTDTYFARSTRSSRIPGALVEDFALTL
jgi:predicted Zn-dependent protease